MLHTSKSQSILQWFNSLTTEVNVQSLSQFADGSHFYDIVSSVYAHIQLENPGLIAALANTPTNEEADDKCAAKVKEILEADVSISKHRALRRNASKSEASLNESAIGDKSFVEVQKKYDVVKKFIDDFFHIESDSLIVYDDCVQGKELELAKVAILLLSALVQNFLSSGNQAVQTTTLLDIHVQEDIKECLSLILMERDEKDGPLTKAEFHKVLSRPAKSKGTPRRRAPSRSEKADSTETPRNIPKKRQKLSSVAHEYVQESPLKELLQSPNTSWVYKAKMTRFKYETEISEIRKSLHEEESKNMDLTLEKRILSEELEKKKRELEFNKENHRQNLEAAEELTARKENEYLRQLEETEKIRSEFRHHVEEFKELEKENKNLIKRIKDLEKQQSEKKSPENSGDSEIMVEAMKKISELETFLSLKEEKITELVNISEKLDRDVKLYRQMYEEEKTRRVMPMPIFSPRVAESVSTIIYADERSAREVLVEREKEINKMKIDFAALKKERDEIAASEKRRQKDIAILISRNKKEMERSKHFENLYKADESQKQNVATVIRQLEKMQDELDNANKKLSAYKECEENVKNSNAESVDGNPNISDSKLELFPISASATSASSALPQFGQLWNTVPSENDLHTKRTKFTSVVADRSRATLSGQERIPNIYCSEAQFHDLKKIARSVVKWLQKQSLVFEDEILRVLDQVTLDILSFCDIATFLQGLLNALKNAKFPISDVTHGRKRRSKAAEEAVINMADMQDQIKNMEKENETLKLEFAKFQENCKAQLEDKESNIKAAKKELQESEFSKEEVQKDLDDSKKEVSDMNAKYECVKKYTERLKRENKRLLKLLLTMSQQEKEQNEAKAEPCRACEKVSKKLTEVKEDLQESELEKEQLKAIVKDLESRIKNMDRQVKELGKEKKKLEFQLERENAFLSGSAADRSSVIRRYFKQGMAESAQKAKAERAEKETQLEQPRHVVSVNTYILHPEKDSCVETSVSNTFANRSVRGGFLQTDDEEDFLNHSSLAQIHNGVFHDSEMNSEERLRELHRRNTLCPPHLQSSYPLEVQSMTPSERKSYDLQRASLQPPHRNIISEAEREFYRKKEAEFLGIEYEDSNDSRPFVLKKRKVSETDSTCLTTSGKKMVSKSSVTRGKVRTPVRRMGSIVTKSHSFKTPSSIRRLMRMPRKNKQQ